MIARVAEDHLDPSLVEVLEVWRSINENLIGAEGHPTQSGLATVVGVRRQGRVELYVHYWLSQSQVGLLYREEDAVTPASYALLRDRAVADLEAMGFIVDNAQFRALDQAGRARLFATPVFGGGVAAADLAEAVLDGEDIEDVEAVTAFAVDDGDPETILVLDETSAVSVPPAPASVTASPRGGRAFPELDSDSWKVFFRMIASL